MVRRASRVVVGLALTGATLSVIALLSCSSFTEFSQLILADVVSDGTIEAPDGDTFADVRLASDATPDAAKDAGLCAAYDAAAARYHFFVSSKVVSGRFAADAATDEAVLGVADALCTEYGKVVNPCSRWRAYISASGENPSLRLASVPGNVYRVRDDAGVLFEAGTKFNTFLKVVPVFDENGDALSATERVWTGVGEGLSGTCTRWQATGPGVVGNPSDPVFWFVDQNEPNRLCSQSHHLYCVEQPP